MVGARSLRVRSRIFGDRNAIVCGDGFAFELVAERRRWRNDGDGNFLDLIPISDGTGARSLQMRSRIFGDRNVIVCGVGFAFGLVAERRRWFSLYATPSGAWSEPL